MSKVAERYGIDLFVEGKVACPKCRAKGGDNSGDNLMVYGHDGMDGHKGAFCWSCSFTIPSTEWLEEHGEVVEEEYEIVGSAFNAEIHQKLKDITTTDGRGFRGISAATTKYFGVLHEINVETNEVAVQYYPCTTEDETDRGFSLTGYKRRRVPKEFAGPIGETGKDCQMFGQFRFLNSNSRKCLIVGGEVDQLSAFQMIKDYYASKGGEYEDIPVVSSTIGESGAHKQVVNQYAWFNRFEQVIICMDNDKAGQEAAEKIAKALPKGKARLMSMSFKDPNEYLEKGRSKEFISAFFNAREYTPSGVVGSGSLMNLIKAAAVVPKIPLPPFMHKVQNMMAGGIPLGTIVNLGSASGTGKSTIIEECVYYWVFNSPHKVGVVSLESDCAQYGIKLLSRHVGTKLDLIEDNDYKVELLHTQQMEDAAQTLFFNEDGSNRWHLVDDRDGSLDNLKELVMSLIIACDCKVIILDPLQDIMDGLSNEEQAVFMKWMKGTVKSHGVTFVNVNHVRKSATGGKANSAGADLHEEDFQGSSAIFKSAACNLLFTRNKEAECDIERNVTLMKMTKCRWTGNTAPRAGSYFYENKSHLMHDLEDYLNKHPDVMARYMQNQQDKED